MAGGNEGHDQQCECIVRDHGPQVYRFLMGLARDAGVADELTQQTFVAAWQKLSTFEQRSSLGTWLCRIAYGKFIDHQRHCRADDRLTTKLKTDAVSPALPMADPLAVMVAAERTQQLTDAVAELDDADRALVVLHYMQDRSFAELAEFFDEPVGTIKWRVHRVLGRLKKRMEDRDR